jgi:hypothetical protein
MQALSTRGAGAAATSTGGARTPPPKLRLRVRRWPSRRTWRWPWRWGWPWYQWLFVALALLYTAPFWVVQFIPTTDGPCHLYNAWILRHWGDAATYPAVNRHFELIAKPFPNWLTHLLLAGLMWVAPPLIAEKLVLSGYVLLFLGGLWYLAGAVDHERRWLAFLGFLLVYDAPLQWGFYNFCYSIGLFLIAVGYWWRRRDSFDLGVAVRLNLLLWLCYFAHLTSTVVALLAIAVLWLATLRREAVARRLSQVAALAPQLLLPLWFLSAQRGKSYPTADDLGALWTSFVRFDAFLGLDQQRRFAAILPAVFVLLLALSVVARLRSPRRQGEASADRRAARDDFGFLLVATVLTAVYFVAPDGMAGGGGLKMRLALYPWLVLIPWLSPALRGGARTAAIGLLALLAALDLAIVLRAYRQAEPQLQAFVHGLDRAASDTVFMPLLFPRERGCAQPCYLAHASGYAAIGKRLVDWDNYEAVTGIFPLRFKDFASHDTLLYEARPQEVKPRELMRQVDYVYCWRMPRDQPIARRIRRNLALVADDGASQLFRSPRFQEPGPPAAPPEPGASPLR